jgi:hypothetical protein
MRHKEFCSVKKCLSNKEKLSMMRIYIRSNEGKEYRDAKYTITKPPKLRKQIWVPVGWLCRYCKKLDYEKGFWRDEN